MAKKAGGKRDKRTGQIKRGFRWPVFPSTELHTND